MVKFTNPFAVDDRFHPDTPKQVYGYRPYILSFSAAWVS